MNRLTDISVYYDPGEKDKELGRLSNYVSELYHNNLKGYKPPKTSRITLTFRETIPFDKPIFTGSICGYFVPFDKLELEGIKDKKERYVFFLKKIHTSCLELADKLIWDKDVFENAFSESLTSGLRLIKEYKQIKSKDRKHWGQCILEKTEESSIVKLRIGNGQVDEVKLLEKRNWYIFDSANRIGEKMKWLDNDKFGFKGKTSGQYLYYSISEKKVETNLKLQYEDM
jgi:hypothetical protein